jgi:hypothetical protein
MRAVPADAASGEHARSLVKCIYDRRRHRGSGYPARCYDPRPTESPPPVIDRVHGPFCSAADAARSASNR